jgi:activator of HSP90 ATPase
VKKIEGTGSVWNTNSYHWEEKAVGKWAEDKMRSILSGFTYKFNDATLTIKEIKTFKGEASVSVRKGKKIIAYDYDIKLLWRVEMKDSEGKVIANTEGHYELPEVSNEEDEWEVRVSVQKDTEGYYEVLKQMIRTLAPKDLKDQIRNDFVKELEKK